MLTTPADVEIPEAEIPVNSDPSPINFVAVTIPVPPNKALPVIPNVAPIPILETGLPISNLPL